MASNTKALQSAYVISSAAILDRDDVVHDRCGDQEVTRFAQPTQRVRTQEGRPQGTPRCRLVEAKLGIKAAPRAPVVPMLCSTVRVAVARSGQHRPATRVSAGRRGTLGHSHLSGGEDLAS